VSAVSVVGDGLVQAKVNATRVHQTSLMSDRLIQEPIGRVGLSASMGRPFCCLFGLYPEWSVGNVRNRDSTRGRWFGGDSTSNAVDPGLIEPRSGHFGLAEPRDRETFAIKPACGR
jgi:hypothetical protein